MKLVLSETISDSAVWRAVLAGDKYAFKVLFRRCYNDLYLGAVTYTGNPDMAEDKVQELFVNIWQCREKLEKVEDVRTYLWTVLRQNIVDAFRNHNIGNRYYDQWDKYDCQMQYPVEELILHDELGAVPFTEITGSVSELSPRQREALYSKFYEAVPDPDWEKAWNRLKNRLDPRSSYKETSQGGKAPRGFFQWIIRVVTLFIISF